jgi:hypothetical protein
LIQSDFDTKASQQEITESHRNVLILESAAEAFVDAVLQFCNHPTLQYHWMRFLPQLQPNHFWAKLPLRINEILQSTPILRPHDNSELRLISELRIVPEDFKDAYGNPLLADSSQGTYLAAEYEKDDIETLASLGVRHLTIVDVLGRVRQDVESPASRLKAPAMSKDWHGRVAKFLLGAFNGQCVALLRDISFIPLADGSFTSMAQGPIYFPGSDRKSIPNDFGIRIVDRESIKDNEWRKALFSAIGIKRFEQPLEVVNPNVSPETLKLALASASFEEVKTLMDEHFSSVAKGDFIWLLELREHNYTTEEITQLLTAERNDSPWIYFEPRELPREAIIPEHHHLFCVHTGGQDVRRSEVSISSTTEVRTEDHRVSWTSDDENLTYIEEFCGLAGVVPNTRDLRQWVGSVQFEEKDTILTASVSFRSDLSDDKPEGGFESPNSNDKYLPQGLAQGSNTLQALESLCNAIGHAQRRGLCCNSFTFLYINSNESGQEVIELRQVRVPAVLELLSGFKAFIANHEFQSGDSYPFMPDILDFAKSILQEATPPPSPPTTSEEIFEYYSLLAQFLCLAFSSYIKAHVGVFQPFFLDTPLQTIQLFGLQDWESGRPHMTASLCRLTCLDDMIHNPVLVFRKGPTRKKIQRSYDLLASPEDLVDTWGPGQFVTSSSEKGMPNLTAIAIGGGVVKPTAANSKTLHWSSDIDPRHGFSIRFGSKEKVLIAGSVEVNVSCQANKSERWSSFIGSLENLGTTPDYWKFTEFQAGVAVMGQQFAGGQFQFNKTWTWHPGNSWKQQHLSLTANELHISELDRPWGLQVSACTGVARRVPLRMLLADMMPVIAENLALPLGWTILRQRGILTALEQGGQYFALWYNELCNLPNFEDLQTLTRRLIRHILLVLRDTGIDRDQKTFLIACPQEHTTGTPISMCLPVPCENASLWAKILTDSENCATFACMTTLCLESREHKCQQTNPWHCPSLDTAVQQLRARKEPITMLPQSWNLEVNCIYWIGRPESGLQARVVKPAGSLFPRLYVSKSGIPEKTRARLGTMGRLFGPKMDRLRERQINTWPAEEVLILSQSR